MSQTTTPSGAEIDIVAVLREQADRYREADAQPLEQCATAVAALIARNAELEAERKARMSADDVLSAIEDSAICLGNWGELHEARDLRRAAYTLIAERDALAAENKALQEALQAMVDQAVSPDFDGAPSLAVYNRATEALARTAAKENDDGKLV